MTASDNQLEVSGIAASTQPASKDEWRNTPLAALITAPSLGYVDIYGYSSAAGGWLFGGWVPRPPSTDSSEPVEFVAHYEQSQTRGSATLAFYQREDVDQNALGVIAFVPGGGRDVGRLQHIEFTLDAIKYRAKSHLNTSRLLDQELIQRLRPHLLDKTLASRNQQHLLSITSRPGFAGQDTLSSLREPVLIQIDEAIFCPPDGLLLRGWQLSAAGAVRSVSVRSGPLASELALSAAIRIDRPDVIATVRQEHGFSDARCGFIAYVPRVISHGDPTYLEVKLENGDVGYKTFKISKRAGIDAIRVILANIDIRYGELDAAFDNILGPAIASINSARLKAPGTVTELQFGLAPENPRYSVIVPLYGRVDFLEYQLALFSRHRGVCEMDLIYVLDDPSKRRELEELASSTYERFRVPFRVLLLSTNLGFAPASNAGLRCARGKFICFLNSDAFPITEDWMERLAARLEHNPEIGLIGPRLLFEDGSIQHEGCFYRVVPELGSWTFSEHLNKGRRPSARQGLRRCEAITGACMVLSRLFAQELGGFDEGYIIGDFEDMDLCRRINARGLQCVIDDGVELYHLERKSQSGSDLGWRFNLTLYNAWVHQRRWVSAHRLPAQTASEPT